VGVLSKHNLVPIAVAISLLVIFLVGFLPNSALFIFIKILLLLTLGGGAFFYLRLPASFAPIESTEIDREDSDSPSQTIPPELLKIKTDENVEEYFELFLKTVFPIIKQTMVANTVVLLMVNYYKKRFYVRYKLTDLEEEFSKETHFGLNQGLLALILRNKKPLVENHLPDSENLLPYYASSGVPVKSFLGVPIFFEDYIVGILCIDSGVEESFSPDDLGILSEFSKVVAIQLASSNKLYEYETENWTTRLLYDFSKTIMEIQTPDELWKYIDASLKKVFGADRIIISERSDQNAGKIVYLSGPAHFLNVGDEYVDNEGLVGWVFRKNQSLLVEDFTTKENYIPRFYADESPAKEFKSFVAVPVTHKESTQFVISLESLKARHFTEQHKKILETMAYQIASFLANARVIQQLRAQSLVDPKTHLGNSKALMSELNKEICRSTEFQRHFSLQILKIHASESTIDEETYDKLVSEFVSFMLPLLNPTNYIFRLNVNHLAIIWPETIFREVLSGFEPVLEELEAKRLWVDESIERAMVNSGVAQFPASGENGTQLIENTRKALAKSELKGINSIEVYEKSESINLKGE
jgi:GAF domain-containing protein